MRFTRKPVEVTPLPVTRVDGAPVPLLGRGRSQHEQLRWWAGLLLDEAGISVDVAPSEPRGQWPGYFDVRMKHRYGGMSQGPMSPAEVRAFLSGVAAAQRHAASEEPA